MYKMLVFILLLILFSCKSSTDSIDSDNGVEKMTVFTTLEFKSDVYYGVEYMYSEVQAGENMWTSGYEEIDLDIPINCLTGALEVLALLQKSNTLVLVTYGLPEQQHKKMKKAGIDEDLFAEVIISNEINKKEEYSKLVERLNLNPENVLVCGDRYETDLLPAKELGMKTIHVCWGRGRVCRPKEGDVDYVVRDLREIIKIVDDF